MTRLGSAGIFLCLNLGMFGPLATAAKTVEKINVSSEILPQSLFRAMHFEVPLVRVSPTSADDDHALSLAATSYNTRSAPDDLTSLSGFVASHPGSGWNVSMLTNLGLQYYHYGYFQRAIDAWHEAWELGKSLTDPGARVVVDRAVGELARMHARLGHADELTALFSEMGDRHVSGDATEAIDGAKDGLWLMRNHPGTAYLCGPMALKNLLLALNANPEKIKFIDDYRSGPHGVSLEEVSQLADKAELQHRIVFRSPGQPIPVPSIVHWRVSHFAAIVGEEKGLYHLADPTFGRDLWVTRSAIDAEASGYFLVPAAFNSTTMALRNVNLSEVSQVRGMGVTTLFEIVATLVGDVVCVDCIYGISQGMATYNTHEMLVSLHISDTPVGYTPPKGPAVNVMLVYNQREAAQPALYEAFNVSQKWTLNWLAYIEDDPNYPGVAVTRYAAGGGSVIENGYSTTTHSFTPETRDASVLVMTSATPVVYQRQLADGGSETYAQSDGSTGTTRHIFLTRITDPSGNSVTLHYDSHLRLTSITDATGRNTSFSYGLSTSPLLITRITDPFGRSAELGYDSTGRLTQITDVLGLKSQFTYDTSSLIDAMTTPYGTTTFAFGDNGNERYLNITDPLGYTERLEYLQEAPGIPYADPVNLIPQGMIGPWNNYLYGRDTWFWDRHAYTIAAGDYTKARNRHWTHQSSNLNITSHTVEAVKNPLENRLWMNYPGQTVTNLSSAESGTFDNPTYTGRVLDDGTTQLSQRTYNAFGHVTDFIDPIGRETQLIYDANQIDVIQVKQKTSASGYSIVAQYTYNNQHLPLTYTDAAGQTTNYRYNQAGQLVRKTDSLGEVTAYDYDNLGYLAKVINPDGRIQTCFTHDRFGRIATATDSEGYTVKYSYDTLDRITKETFPDGTTREYMWNRLDLASLKDRQDNTTLYTHDAVRNLTQITDPLGHQAKLAYYENGELKSLTDSDGNTTTWNIDIQGRVTAKIFADGSQVARTYEAGTGRVHSVTDALKQVKQFSYASDDSLVGIVYDNAVNSTPNVAFTYDPYFHRVTTMTDGTGITQYNYYPVGMLGAMQLANEVVPEPKADIQYQYDALTRLKSRTIDGTPESYTYDKLSRLIFHSTPLGQFQLGYLGQTSQLTTRMTERDVVGTRWIYNSNLDDRRLKAIDNIGSARSFEFTTTPENLITGIRESYAFSGHYGSEMDDSSNEWSFRQSQYGPDDDDQRDKTASSQWRYEYDNDYRLTDVDRFHKNAYRFQYDPSDNITSIEEPKKDRNATYNNLNQIVTFSGVSYLYDANGNVIDDGVRTFEWDAENRLLSITWKNAPIRKTEFRYDGLGRRTEVDTTSIDGTTQARYVWCEETLCQARSANDSVTRRYYPEGELHLNPEVGIYYSQDQLGSVRDALQIKDGARLASFDYQPYGAPTRSTGKVTTDFRFAGLFYDPQDEVYLANHRVYDPASSKWLSRDPLQEEGGLNLYAYSTNPISDVDPDGLFQYRFLVTQPDPATTAQIERILGQEFATLEEGAEEGPLGFLAATIAIIWSTPDASSIPQTNHCPCKPCVPPVGAKGYRLDTAPQGPHFDKPTQTWITGPHWHEFAVYQSSPPAGCRCSWKNQKRAFPYPPLPAGAFDIKTTPVTGGGIQ